ncbi:transmembrane protein [Legionella beliardensis]|uniref:Transmembrane protein n=1 Tax=Legionella beliardensis TaxID=91822 RepID=A0A378I8G7_9GAMM|nr:DMT family transporter [Legionella beliardensis]STX28674.1 transmembrane protein [Legionella beliardensis]
MKKHNNAYLLGLLLLILAQIMVGLNIVLSKKLVNDIPTLLLINIRFALASIILLPLHWLTPAKEKSLVHHLSLLNNKDWYFIFGQALSAGVLFNLFMLLGLHTTDANVAGIITSTLPAIIAIMSFIFLKEKLSAKIGFCILFATLGLIVIATEKFNHLSKAHSFLGDLVIFVALLPEAAYYVLYKMHISRLPVFLISAVMNGINAIVLLPFSLFEITHIPNISANHWLILSSLGISTSLFYIFWYFGSQRVDGIMASLSTAVMPIGTVIFAWLLLGEQLTNIQFFGMGLVISSIVFYAKQ